MVLGTSGTSSAPVRIPHSNQHSSSYSNHGVSRNGSSAGVLHAAPAQNRRWVPPSTVKRDDKPSRYMPPQKSVIANTNVNPGTPQSDQIKNDHIFRCVRGILNKLTPEKFEKLVNDILALGLDSSLVLKGVILLIFEKALDEPKYSSMYAQLCKRLAENAPNFEPLDKPCTFKRLLLNKCKDEFENRAQLCLHYEKQGTFSTASDEEDAKYYAKRKMLGNIKFIGELGKLQIIQEFILHKCCEQLLLSRRKQSIDEQAEDLECLCHLFKTCGKILDTTIAKARMDQYFERLQRACENEQLPNRIRFLIQDILDLRRNKWQFRKVGKGPEGPRTIQQVREDAARDGCIYMPQEASPSSLKVQTPLGMLNPLEGMFFEKGPKRQGMEDLFGGGGGYFPAPPTTSGYMGTSFGSYEDDTDSFMGKYAKNNGSNNTGLGANNFSKTFERKLSTGERHSSFSSEPRTSPVRKVSEGQPLSTDSGFANPRANSESPNMTAPPPDFGDRYSANRSKDRERRTDYNRNGNYNNGNEPYHNNNVDRKNFRNESDHAQNEFDPRSGINHSQESRGGGGRYRAPGHRDFPSPQHDNGVGMAPRFKKTSFNQPPPPLGNGSTPFTPPNLSMPPPTHMGAKDIEVSLRPQQITSNMLFKPKTPSMLPKSAISRTTDGTSPLGENSLLGPSLPPMHQKIMQQKEGNIFIKQGSLDAKSRKEKKAAANRGPTREEVFAKVDEILNQFLNNQSSEVAIESWKENDWLPSKMAQTGVTHLFKLILDKTDEQKKSALTFVVDLMTDGAINKTHCFEAVNKLVSPVTAASIDKSSLAVVAAWCVNNKVYSLSEIADLLQGGQWHPVFLEILKHLYQDSGKEHLIEAYESASIRLMDQLPESGRTDSNLAQVLETYGLSFLMPLLSIRQDVAKQLNPDTNPSAFLKWINENVDLSFHNQPGFILALFDIIFKSVVDQSTLPENADPAQAPDKNLVEIEKELLTKYRSVLQPFVHEKPALQLAAVYALQVFCHENGFPKGMLLRSFVNCYELDILDEQAFLNWKEDVNGSYPGKGKALFQVNQWLTWLEEAESEDEEDDQD